MDTKNKIIATLLIVSILSFFAPKSARAGYWGEDLEAAVEEVTLTKMLDTIEKTMVANLKIMAIRVIQGRLQVLLTGSCGAYCIGGSSGMITDWQDYIFGSAQRTAESTVNTFFNGMKSGVGSGMERVVNNVQKRFDAEVLNTKKPDLHNYTPEGKISNIFDPTQSTSNRWLALRMSGEPQNDPAWIDMQARKRYEAAFNNIAELQKTKGIAGQGFPGTEKKKSSSSSYAAGKYGSAGYGTEGEVDDETNTTTLMQGKVTGDLYVEGQEMGMKMIAFAKSIPEVVANMVTQTLTNVINYGIRQVTDPIDKSITDVRNKVGTSINQTQSDIQSGVRNSIYFNKKQ